MTRAALLAYIDNNVYPNANNEITALMVRDVLHHMVDFLGDAATYGVGDVALNNGGLVTGGAVQSAINTTLSSAIMFQGVTTTPLTDGSTNPNITIDGESYTAHRGDEVIYGGKEFLWTGTKWQQLGDEESWAAKTITISAGAGLTGGGNLTQNRTISLSQDSLDKLALAASAYQLPSTGIPLADLAAGVQSSLGRADSAYQLPQGGIPKTDLASAVQNSLGKADTVAGYFSNDKLKLQNLPDLYVARTQVSGTAANKTLYGVNGISAAAAANANDKSLIEWDDTNKVWHVHGGIYAEGVLSGGGLSQSSPGGGGGGLDPALMWKYLTNDPTLSSNPYANTKIADAHLPDLNPGTGVSASYSGNLYLNLSLNYSAVAGQLGLSGMAYKPANQQTIVDALGYTPANATALNDYLPKAGGTMTGPITFNYGAGTGGQYSTTYDQIVRFNGLLHINTRSNQFVISKMGTNGLVLDISAITSGANTQRFQAKDGTIALTSDLSDYLPLSAGSSKPLTGTLYAQSIIPASNFTYDLGIAGTEWKHASIRGIAARHLDASDTFSGDNTLHIGYGNDAPTTAIKLYYSSQLASASYLPTEFFEVNAWGAYALTRFGVNGQNVYATFYVNGSSYLNGDVTIDPSYSLDCKGLLNVRKRLVFPEDNYTIYSTTYNELVNYNNILHANVRNGQFVIAIMGTNGAILDVNNLTAGRTFYFPNTGGTFALTSNLDSYLPLSAGSGKPLTDALFIDGNYEYKVVFNHDSAYNNIISFRLNRSQYGWLGTYGSTDLRWSGNKIWHEGNAGTTSYSWSCSNLEAAGAARIHGAITGPHTYIGSNTIGFNRNSDVGGILIAGYYGGQIGVSGTTGNMEFAVTGPNSDNYIVNAYLYQDGSFWVRTGIWTPGYLSGGGLSQSSDRRLKRFIEDFSYTPGLLMALRPREWEWNDKTPMQGHAAGFVAQEVEGLLPYMVDDTREYLALYYDQFHALEVAALRDHETRLVAIEKENEAIRKENVELRLENRQLRERLNMN